MQKHPYPSREKQKIGQSRSPKYSIAKKELCPYILGGAYIYNGVIAFKDIHCHRDVLLSFFFIVALFFRFVNTFGEKIKKCTFDPSA